MESLITLEPQISRVQQNDHINSKFIESNTIPLRLEEIRDKHIIPVFLKDNEPAISQVEFIEVVAEAVKEKFNLREFPKPDIRVSHPVKGRVYEARHKKAAELLPYEKTIYYERLAFLMEIPGTSVEVNGNPINLTVGGIKSFNLDNLNTSKGGNEHFKIFVGYKNTVCTNLCISTDGTKLDLKVKSLDELFKETVNLLCNYDDNSHITTMQELTDFELSESEFAQIVGKARLYQYLPKDAKANIPELLINDTQISRVAEHYYSDPNFNRNANGSIDLWRFYNLLTGAVKSSYIDKFLEKELNCFDFAKQVKEALNQNNSNFWYLN